MQMAPAFVSPCESSIYPFTLKIRMIRLAHAVQDAAHPMSSYSTSMQRGTAGFMMNVLWCAVAG